MTDALNDPTIPRNTHLLIVDDEPLIRSSLRRALELSGYTVTEAESGVQALLKLQQSRYDLMLLDLHMPGMNGVEVMVQARLLHPELLIVVLTGHATVESAITAVKLEAVDYLRKPANLQEIVSTINRALQKRARQLHQQHLMDIMTGALEALRQVETVASQSLNGPDHGNQHLEALRQTEAVVSHPLEMDTPAESHLLHVSPLTLDPQKLLVTVEGNPPRIVELTEGEGTVLRVLMSYPDQVLSCQKLASAAWDYDVNENEAEGLIRPYIFRLRQKVEVEPKKPCVIQTVRSRGYIFSSAIPEIPPKKPQQNFFDLHLDAFPSLIF